MLVLERGSVTITPHNEGWCDEEKDLLLNACGDDSPAVEHIGSTAICGIAAKPILDIMVGTPEYQPELAFVSQLKAVGYEYKGENGVPERHFLGKEVPRMVHLNVVSFGGQFWFSHITFRDFLKQNLRTAREYEQLKLSLAKRFSRDRESYTNGKLAFVEKILKRRRL
jgi:GrpB-like predicted nucleotidyltransferase (UPF0157 family)